MTAEFGRLPTLWQGEGATRRLTKHLTAGERAF